MTGTVTLRDANISANLAWRLSKQPGESVRGGGAVAALCPPQWPMWQWTLAAAPGGRKKGPGGTGVCGERMVVGTPGRKRGEPLVELR